MISYKEINLGIPFEMDNTDAEVIMKRIIIIRVDAILSTLKHANSVPFR